MDRERVGVHRRGRKPDLTLRQRLIGLISTLTFGGLQWCIAGWLSGVPSTTLHSSFARWTRLGLWRQLGQRLAFDWRLACGDEVLPSAVVADSRSLRSAPTAWVRGIDGGKLVKGVKLFVVCDKRGSLLDLELQAANTDDRAGVLPMLPRLAAQWQWPSWPRGGRAGACATRSDRPSGCWPFVCITRPTPTWRTRASRHRLGQPYVCGCPAQVSQFVQFQTDDGTRRLFSGFLIEIGRSWVHDATWFAVAVECC